jgi:hypothetical protein
MMGSSNKNDNPTQVLQNSEGNEKMTLAAHETFYFVGALDELKIVISNSAEVITITQQLTSVIEGIALVDTEAFNMCMILNCQSRWFTMDES